MSSMAKEKKKFFFFGFNDYQIYFKVPGARTPAHLENGWFGPANLNVGPGNVVWICVPFEFAKYFEKMQRISKEGLRHLFDHMDAKQQSLQKLADELRDCQLPVAKKNKKALKNVKYNISHTI